MYTGFFVVDLDKVRYLGNRVMEPADPFLIFHRVFFPADFFLMTGAAAAVGCPTGIAM